jgi:hypothetical protein
VQLEIPDRREGGVMRERVTEAGVFEGGVTEGAQWVLVGMLAVMAIAPAIAVVGMYLAERHHEHSEAWEAEHPHEQVEPPRIPEHYQHVERAALEPLDREVLDVIHTKRDAAPDHDPAVGDLVITFVDLVVDGVVWPRETYVRALVGPMGTAAAKLVSEGDTIDVPRETIASVVHLTGPAPDPVEKPRSRAMARRRVKGPAKGRNKPQARSPERAASTRSEPPAQPSEPVEPDSQPADLEVQPEQADNTPPTPLPRGPAIARGQLQDRHFAWVARQVKHQWPTRPHGPELVPERGDDVAVMVGAPSSAEQPMIDLLVGRIHAVGDDTLDIEVLGNLDRGFGVPKVGHGYMAGDRFEMMRCLAISIIKPAPRLLAKSRHKRYRVGVGELIELRPDTIPELPPDSAWHPSRPDVAVRVVEQDSSRSVVAFDGPAGAVNLTLVTSTNGKPRTVCGWKFEIATHTS